MENNIHVYEISLNGLYILLLLLRTTTTTVTMCLSQLNDRWIYIQSNPDASPVCVHHSL